MNAQGDPNVDHRHTYNLPEVHGVLRRLGAMVDAYPGNHVLICEAYVFKTTDLDTWYGGEAQDELQLPMDTSVGFGLSLMGKPATLNASSFRRYIEEADTQLQGSRPRSMRCRSRLLEPASPRTHRTARTSGNGLPAELVQCESRRQEAPGSEGGVGRRGAEGRRETRSDPSQVGGAATMRFPFRVKENGRPVEKYSSVKSSMFSASHLPRSSG